MILLHFATVVSRTALAFEEVLLLQANKAHIFWSLHTARYSWSASVGDGLAARLRCQSLPYWWQSTLQQARVDLPGSTCPDPVVEGAEWGFRSMLLGQ